MRWSLHRETFSFYLLSRSKEARVLRPYTAAGAARAIGGPTPPAANVLTASRLFCNAFKHPALRDVFLLNASEMLVSPRRHGRGGALARFRMIPLF